MINNCYNRDTTCSDNCISRLDVKILHQINVGSNEGMYVQQNSFSILSQ